MQYWSLFESSNFDKHFRKQSLTCDDYQFLHRSTIPTYHFQKSLRRLPIPKLELTCQRFLAAAEAVLPNDRYSSLKLAVENFERTDGQELQRDLLAYDKQNKHTSYISEPWFDKYLKDRIPCPINYNPFMMFAPDPQNEFNNQLVRATNFVISFGRFKRSLDANVLSPEVFHLNPKKSDTNFFRTICRNLPANLSWFGAVLFKAFPLDMSQYKNLFGGTRIPQVGKDKLYHCANSKSFVVIRHGKFYSVDLFDDKGLLVSAEQVYACIAAILNDSTLLNANECIGSLTCLNRDKWAEIRNQLCSDERNVKSITAIDNALFVLCLDSVRSEDPDQLAENFLTGVRNFYFWWFDKCFQLIVDEFGHAAINFEHSWGDGVAVLRLLEETFKDTNANHFVAPGQSVDSRINVNSHFRPLGFVLSNSVREKITTAQAEYKSLSSALHFGHFEYFGLSRKSIKLANLSPDAIAQLSFQLAFYKQYGEFVPTYESCSTAAFLKGRTECIRSLTVISRDTVLAIENDANGLLRKIQECSRQHSELVKEAAMGAGFDRHLMGLFVTAERLGKTIPDLFLNNDFEYMKHFILSTSTLSSSAIALGGFGPVVQDGFGIGYTVTGAKIGAAISSFKDKRDAKLFSNLILESLDRLRDIINSGK